MPIGGDAYMLNCRARVVWLCLLLGVYWDAPTASLAQAVPGLDEQRTLAERGDADAQFTLGAMYSRGQGGVVQDAATATHWFRLAADQGHEQAQLTLGVHYLTGDGVPQDPTEAVRLFRLAGEQGNVFAQNNLGVVYQGVPEPFRTEKDVPIDHAESVRWFRRAADQGHAVSAMNLAVKYRRGDGIAQDYTQAFVWFLRSAELGDVNARREVGGMYAAGQGVAQNDIEAYMWLDLAVLQASGEDREMLLIDREAVAERMTGEQIAEAQRRVNVWTPSSR